MATVPVRTRSNLFLCRSRERSSSAERFFLKKRCGHKSSSRQKGLRFPTSQKVYLEPKWLRYLYGRVPTGFYVVPEKHRAQQNVFFFFFKKKKRNVLATNRRGLKKACDFALARSLPWAKMATVPVQTRSNGTNLLWRYFSITKGWRFERIWGCCGQRLRRIVLGDFLTTSVWNQSATARMQVAAATNFPKCTPAWPGNLQSANQNLIGFALQLLRRCTYPSRERRNKQ